MRHLPPVHRSDDPAVSNVLGAILMFALFVISLVVIRVEFAPVWDEDREARHMDEVLGQLAQVKSDLDRQVDNRTDVGVSDPIRLDRQPGFRFLQGGGLPGSLAFDAAAAGTGVEISSPRMTILVSNGQSFYGITDPNDWEIIDGTEDEYIDVDRVRALRVRVLLPPDLNYYEDGDSATLAIDDINGDPVGSAVVTFRDLPSEWALQIQIFADTDSDGAIDDEVSSDLEAFFQQTAGLQYFYVDLMDPSLLFDAILASAEGPLQLAITQDGLDAAYVVVFDSAQGGGTGTSGGAIGLVVDNYAAGPFEGGLLGFHGSNSRFVDQDYLLEHGAIVRIQEGVAVVAVPPRLAVTVGSAQTRIEWDLPSLGGVTQQLAGARSASILLDPAERTSLEATARRITFEIPTAYPDAWEAFLHREFIEAGLSTADLEYSIQPTGSGIILTVDGETIDPNVGDDDLFFVFRQASIDVELRSSG